MDEEIMILGLIVLVGLLSMLLVQIGTVANEVQRIRKHVTDTTDNDSLRAAKFDVAYIFGFWLVIWLLLQLGDWLF